MSLNLNNVQIVGRLVRDPEMKQLPSGQNITNLSIATNHVYTKDGEKKESVEYHNVVVFGKQAENSAKFLKKGQYAQVTGRLQTRSWDKDGVKMYRTEIIADSVQFGDAGTVAAEPATASKDEELEPEDIPF